jgi:predicted RNA methylase
LKTLKAITETLLSPELNYKTLYDDIHRLHDIYSEHTGVRAEGRNDKHIMLPTGKAISTISAAHCLLELMRTRVFVKGIHKAILTLQERFKGQTIHILYAGCGPYATLLTPLTQVFSPEEVAFHLLDINPDSLAAVKELYKGLQLTSYVASYMLQDATTFTTEAHTPMHLMISETMLDALRNEPQVAIMQNLLPQLPVGGLFIPEKITVSAKIINWPIEMAAMLESFVPERVELGDVYSIGQEGYSSHKGTTFTIPEYKQGFNTLQLFTDIVVYEDEILTKKDCSLNMPKNVCNIREQEGRQIHFQYEMGSVPQFVHSIL